RVARLALGDGEPLRHPRVARLHAGLELVVARRRPRRARAEPNRGAATRPGEPDRRFAAQRDVHEIREGARARSIARVSLLTPKRDRALVDERSRRGYVRSMRAILFSAACVLLFGCGSDDAASSSAGSTAGGSGGAATGPTSATSSSSSGMNDGGPPDDGGPP